MLVIRVNGFNDMQYLNPQLADVIELVIAHNAQRVAGAHHGAGIARKDGDSPVAYSAQSD